MPFDHVADTWQASRAMILHKAAEYIVYMRKKNQIHMVRDM